MEYRIKKLNQDDEIEDVGLLDYDEQEGTLTFDTRDAPVNETLAEIVRQRKTQRKARRFFEGGMAEMYVDVAIGAEDFMTALEERLIRHRVIRLTPT